MRPITVMLLSAALIATGAAVFVANKVVQNRAAAAAAAQQAAARDVDVLVAAHFVPQGRILREVDLRWEKWPINTATGTRVIVRKDGQAMLAHLPAKAVRRSLSPGEPIKAETLFAPGTAGSFMPGMIEPGKKAVGITVTAASTASGFVLPGDIVDVIVTIDMRKAEATLPGGGRFASETILEDVRVLAVDQNIVPGQAPAAKAKAKAKAAPAAGADEPEEVSLVGKTVAIEVTAEEAERVLAGQAAGSLSLVLQSMTNDVGNTADAERSYITDVDVSRALRRATGTGVKIIKGGQVAR